MFIRNFDNFPRDKLFTSRSNCYTVSFSVFRHFPLYFIMDPSIFVEELLQNERRRVNKSRASC